MKVIVYHFSDITTFTHPLQSSTIIIGQLLKTTWYLMVCGVISFLIISYSCMRCMRTMRTMSILSNATIWVCKEMTNDIVLEDDRLTEIVIWNSDNDTTMRAVVCYNIENQIANLFRMHFITEKRGALCRTLFNFCFFLSSMKCSVCFQLLVLQKLPVKSNFIEVLGNTVNKV